MVKKRWRLGSVGRGRTWAAAGTGALALTLVVLGGPTLGSAASGNTTPITYTVNPISVQATASASTSGLTPGYCIANFGIACYTPQIFHTAYQVPWYVNNKLAGSGESVAIIDAYGSPTVVQDLATFDKAFGLPAAHINVYYPGGQVPFNPIVKGSLQAGWAEETSLDVQTVHDLAPGATINLVIANSSSGNVLNNAEQYAVTNHLGVVMSMSYGAPEVAIAGGGNNLQVQQADAIFQQAAAAGIGVFASSGDSGAGNGYTTSNALFPASDPNVTATGGTDLFVSGDTSARKSGNLGTYQSEYTWNDSYPATCPFGCAYGVFGATGGAPSSIFASPSYQQGVTGVKMRTTSDVSFNASVYTATLIYLGFLGGANNGFYFFGGTSEASPAWAAITAVLDQAHGSQLGAMNPILYGLASNPTSYAADFHDITVGNNQLPYPTGPGTAARVGYDQPTGLGTPIVSGLLASLAPGVSLSYTAP